MPPGLANGGLVVPTPDAAPPRTEIVPPRTETAPPRAGAPRPCMPAGEGVLTVPLPTGEGPLGAPMRTPEVPDRGLTAPDGASALVAIPLVGEAPSKPALPLATPGDGVRTWPAILLEEGLGPPTEVGVPRPTFCAELTAGLVAPTVPIACPAGLNLETTGIGERVTEAAADCGG